MRAGLLDHLRLTGCKHLVTFVSMEPEVYVAKHSVLLRKNLSTLGTEEISAIIHRALSDPNSSRITLRSDQKPKPAIHRARPQKIIEYGPEGPLVYCPMCKQTKPEGAFGRNKRRPNGRQGRCRECFQTSGAEVRKRKREQ